MKATTYPTIIKGGQVYLARLTSKLVKYVGERIVDGILYAVYLDEHGKEVLVF